MYLVIVLSVLVFIVRTFKLDALVKRRFPLDPLAQYPTLKSSIDAFPEEGPFKASMRRHAERFVRIYERSFVLDFAYHEQVQECRHHVGKFETAAHEILFRIPSDLRTEQTLRDHLAVALAILNAYIRDMRRRWDDFDLDE